uniref:Uncharacterized protein n=1 Tax=Triticum urartu TaxID=4572 RepID=A0A8R7TP58_TRIUA
MRTTATSNPSFPHRRCLFLLLPRSTATLLRSGLNRGREVALDSSDETRGGVQISTLSLDRDRCSEGLERIRS